VVKFLRKDFYPATHNSHNTQTSMPSVGLETTVLASERPQTCALDRAATGTSFWYFNVIKFLRKLKESRPTLIKLMHDYLMFNFWHIIQILTFR